MLLKIKSSNPAFSWILAKNPETQKTDNKPFNRNLRQGKVFGWFTNEQQFTLWFKDAQGRSSFDPEASFEYLDQTRYSAPDALLGMIDEMLKSAASGHELDVPGYEHTITVPALAIKRSKLLETFCQHVPDVPAEFTALGCNIYKLELKSAETLRRMLGWLRLFCLFQMITGSAQLETSRLAKYARLLAEQNAPYFIRYLFARTALKDRGVFNKLRASLDTESIKLCFGDTRQQRFDAVKPYLTGGECLVDIGCGEGWQASRLAKHYSRVQAYDLDAEQQAVNRSFATRRGLDNVEFLDGVQDPADLTVPEGAHVLMLEVAEHMEQEKAQALVEAVLAQNAGKLLVTTPNRLFNEHYLLGEEFRHDDHHWEMPRPEFEVWMTSLATEAGYSVKVTGIGDSVDGEHTSLLAIFEKDI